MTKGELSAIIPDLFEKTPGNEFDGYKLVDEPIIGFGSADDPLFDEYKKPGIIGPWFMKPEEWLPGAKAVVALFFPISKQIRDTNRSQECLASVPWTYGRVDGQNYIRSFTNALCTYLGGEGIHSVYPQYDPRFEVVRAGNGISGYDEIDKNTFGSRWSERHAAYVCGLGTFCLSKGLITSKGVAGRFATIIIDYPFEPDLRPYTGIYDYCTKCGKCVTRCPVDAIDLLTGKDHNKCHKHLEESKVIFYPKFGCGLCQVDVPCEAHIPANKTP